MGFLSKQIGVVIMENFKIYIHHNYSYERFWYFFHGVDVDIKNVPTHTSLDTAFNKNIPITDQVTIPIKYKDKEITVSFVGDNQWKSPGHHIFDYSIFLYDMKMVSDRGFNSNIMDTVDNIVLPKLNSSITKKSKIHFIYIDWEGHNAYKHHKFDTKLNKNINVYVDENDELYSYPNSYNPFSLNFMSFIYPNTLGLREYVFFNDFLKNKKSGYKHKMNYPIRRIYRPKLEMFAKIEKTKNINITHSSFHDTKQYSNDQVDNHRKTIKELLGEENIIQKRGYGLDDWGGEWNDDNLKEFLFKMFNIAEVSILPEYYWKMNLKSKKLSNEELKKIGTHYMTEKTVTHILAGKPFIPFHRETIEYYDSILLDNGFTPIQYPLEFDELIDVIDELDELANDEKKWIEFRDKLQKWVDVTRNSILKIVDTRNHFLDVIIKEPDTIKKASLL